MSGQPNVGCKHKPKCEVTHEWNIDKHRDEREECNTESMCTLKMLKTPTAATLMPPVSESSALVEVRSFPRNHKAKPIVNNTFFGNESVNRHYSWQHKRDAASSA
jgi:hypothetical protein